MDRDLKTCLSYFSIVMIIGINISIIVIVSIGFHKNSKILRLYFPFDNDVGGMNETLHLLQGLSLSDSKSNSYRFKIMKGCYCPNPKKGDRYCGQNICGDECTKEMTGEEGCKNTGLNETKFEMNDLNGISLKPEYKDYENKRFYLKNKLIIPDEEQCPDTYKRCGKINDYNTLCLSKNYSCPLNSIVISNKNSKEIENSVGCRHNAAFNITIENGTNLTVYTSKECYHKRIIDSIEFFTKMDTSYQLENFEVDSEKDYEKLEMLYQITKEEFFESKKIKSQVEELPLYPKEKLKTDHKTVYYEIKYSNPFDKFMKLNFKKYYYSKEEKDFISLLFDDEKNMEPNAQKFLEGYINYEAGYPIGKSKATARCIIAILVFECFGIFVLNPIVFVIWQSVSIIAVGIPSLIGVVQMNKFIKCLNEIVDSTEKFSKLLEFDHILELSKPIRTYFIVVLAFQGVQIIFILFMIVASKD